MVNNTVTPIFSCVTYKESIDVALIRSIASEGVFSIVLVVLCGAPGNNFRVNQRMQFTLARAIAKNRDNLLVER